MTLAGTERSESAPSPTPERSALRRAAVAAAKAGLRGGAMASARWRVPPDFLIIGGKRCGTTSAYNYLLRHPLVRPLVPRAAKIKGTYFFDVHYGRGLRWYRSHFPTRWVTGPGAVTGEASPYYLGHPLAAERAARAVPGARIVVLLRDPVDRAYSHWREQVRRGREVLDFPAALAAEDRRLAGEEERLRTEPGYYSRAHEHFAYLSRGRYAEQLPAWTDRFPAERRLVLRSEDLYADPAGTYAELCRFLRLPPHELGSWRRHNFHAGEGMDAGLRAELSARFAEPNRALEAMLGRRMGWSG